MNYFCFLQFSKSKQKGPIFASTRSFVVSKMKACSNHKLIVEFPTSEHANNAVGAQSSDSRSVRFAVSNSICFIEDETKSENNIKWNSKLDFKTYRHTLKADVKKVVNILDSKPQGEVRYDDLIQCVGIETFLSESLFNHIMKRRTKHIRSVLKEQLRQEQQNISDASLLRCVSERSSKWSVDRATELARGYWEME